MKRFFLSLLPLTAAVLLGACEKEDETVVLPENTSKLVVTSFISPQDTAVFVTLSRSSPLFGAQQQTVPMVDDAVVTLSDGEQTVTLNLPDQPYGQYWIATKVFPVVAGRTYRLQVSVPGGESVEASCTVPEAPPGAPSIVLDSIQPAESPYQNYLLRMSWSDVAGQPDYYRPMAEIRVKYRLAPEINPTEPYRYGFYDFTWESDEVTDDHGKDGDLFYSPRGRAATAIPGQNEERDVYAHLVRIDQHYYRYHRSLHEAVRSKDNPFAEPVLVYSNIKGGLGIFSARNRITTVLKLQ